MALQVGDFNGRGEQVIAVVHGIPITAEGKARARVKLDAARAGMTPENWAALRAKLGMDASPRARRPGYAGAMGQDTEREDVPRPTEIGTPEGRAWARKVLDEGRARMTDADWQRLRDRFGHRERHIA
jgi:hypothetical protein